MSERYPFERPVDGYSQTRRPAPPTSGQSSQPSQPSRPESRQTEPSRPVASGSGAEFTRPARINTSATLPPDYDTVYPAPTYDQTMQVPSTPSYRAAPDQTNKEALAVSLAAQSKALEVKGEIAAEEAQHRSRHYSRRDKARSALYYSQLALSGRSVRSYMLHGRHADLLMAGRSFSDALKHNKEIPETDQPFKDFRTDMLRAVVFQQCPDPNSNINVKWPNFGRTYWDTFDEDYLKHNDSSEQKQLQQAMIGHVLEDSTDSRGRPLGVAQSNESSNSRPD